MQGTQERPSLDKDFYNDAGWNRFEAKAEGPVADSKATWPTLEQEREEAMNIHGWYDPRVSRGWEPKQADVGEKKQATEADKKEVRRTLAPQSCCLDYAEGLGPVSRNHKQRPWSLGCFV
jgi:hypothetical protein